MRDAVRTGNSCCFYFELKQTEWNKSVTERTLRQSIDDCEKNQSVSELRSTIGLAAGIKPNRQLATIESLISDAS